MLKSNVGRTLLSLMLGVGLVMTTANCEMIEKLKGGTGDEPKKEKKDKKKDDDESEESEESEEEASAKPSAEPSAAPTATETASAAPSADAPPAEDEVTRYPDEVPGGGTYRLLKNFVVYKAADVTSKELGRVAQGTLVNLKSTHANWMLVEWPSGIGELSLGWIEAKRFDPSVKETSDKIDASVKDAANDATVKTDASTTPDAGVKTDAGVKADGGRRPIGKIPRIP
jgi:hypothetical protein